MAAATAQIPPPAAVKPRQSVSSLNENNGTPDVNKDRHTESSTIHDMPKTGSRRHDRERKIGHRRVDEAGQVTYKKKPTSELMAAIQLGVSQSVGILASKPHRDILLEDFSIVECTVYPREGSNLTPAHHCSDFRFKTYAPIAFRYFRELFGIQPDDFLLSMCNEPMKELSNPGASGSIFYITTDDEFIVKTVQHSEADFLQKLLPGYFMNLNQNPRTLLPKFYGLYCYQCGGKNIRFTVMNNLLPSTIKMHEKYDLKGSTYKRRASKHERQKKTPTYKDLDFIELHPEGILLEADTYSALCKTIERDCRVLQSFKIMDYSLLIGVHNLDAAAREREHAELSGEEVTAGSATPDVTSPARNQHNTSVARGRSMKQRVAQYSTAMEAIQAHADPLELDNEDIPPGGIPARNSKGERLLLYLGMIDVLQSYRFRKKIEHAMKSMVHDGDTISVHRPGYYAQRFQSFFAEKVFRKIPSPMKHSPTKKKQSVRPRSVTMTEVETRTAQVHVSAHDRAHSESDPAGAVGGRPDLLPSTTPPPTFSEATARRLGPDAHALDGAALSLESISPTDTLSYANKLGVMGATPSERLYSPAHSVTDSAPTFTEYTEGTPSYTASSASCSSDVLDCTRSVPSTTESTRKEYTSRTVHNNTRTAHSHDVSMTTTHETIELDFTNTSAQLRNTTHQSEQIREQTIEHRHESGEAEGVEAESVEAADKPAEPREASDQQAETLPGEFEIRH